MNQKFIQDQVKIHGKEKAEKWVNSIPLLIKKYEKEWNIKVGKAFPNILYNYVATAITQNGEEVVFKIGNPGDKLFLAESQFLRIYNGEGAIKLLKNNLENRVLLLEKCVPGNSLDTLNDETNEILIFTDIAKKSWREISSIYDFPKISDDLQDFEWYFKSLDKYKYLMDEYLVRKAQAAFKYLIETQKDLVLLNSDLHHDHILLSKRGWLAIDCRGAIGEKEYIPSHFIRNPVVRAKKKLITKDIILRRAEIISQELNLDRERIIKWAFTQTVLAVIWSLQDTNTKPSYWVDIAEELEQLIHD